MPPPPKRPLWRCACGRPDGVSHRAALEDDAPQIVQALVEMTRAAPTTLAELAVVSGVCAKKLDAYGAAILAVIGK